MAISLLNNVLPLYNYSDFFYDSVPISQVETLYHLSSMLRTSTPRRKFALWNLLKTLCAEIWKVYFSAQIFICFKNGQNRCRVSGQNQVILSHRNSKHFGTEFPPPNFFVKTHCRSSLMFRVSSKSVKVWGSYNRKTLQWPSQANAI